MLRYRVSFTSVSIARRACLPVRLAFLYLLRQYRRGMVAEE